MFFRKTERKKHSAFVIMAIGALAAVGAVSITKCGKQILCEARNKVMGFFKKDGDSCSLQQEECGM